MHSGGFESVFGKGVWFELREYFCSGGWFDVLLDLLYGLGCWSFGRISLGIHMFLILTRFFSVCFSSLFISCWYFGSAWSVMPSVSASRAVILPCLIISLNSCGV